MLSPPRSLVQGKIVNYYTGVLLYNNVVDSQDIRIVSSVVEQGAVNTQVGGPIPSQSAIY